LNPDFDSTKPQVVDLASAKLAGKPRYFTGVACVNGHLVERFVSSKACVVCARANQNKWNSKNADKLRGYGTKHYANNAEKQRESARRYRRDNPEAANGATRRYRKKKPEVISAHVSKRRARQLQAMPTWVNKDLLFAFYKQSKDKAKETGVAHHVDHIIPLVNKHVCGLHVPWNLQVIPAKENQQKRNKFNLDV